MASFDDFMKQSGVKPSNAPGASSPPESESRGNLGADTVARGLGAFSGWPVDLATTIANLGIAGYGTVKGALGSTDLPSLIQRPVGGSQMITEGYRRLFGQPTEGVRPAGMVDRMLADTAVNAMGIAGGGAQMATRPAVAQGLLAAGGMSAGKEIAAQLAPDSPEWQMAGSMLGGALAPARVSGARELYDDLVNLKTSGKVHGLAERVLDRAIKQSAGGYPTKTIIDNIDEAQRLSQKIPGFNPSTAEATGIPALQALQDKYSGVSARNLNRESARQQTNTSAIEAAYQGVIPGAGRPSDPRSAINRSLADEAQGITAEQAQLAGSLPRSSQRAQGQELIDIANAERQSVRANVIRPAYERAFRLAGNREIDITPVVNQAEQILQRRLSEFRPETAPNTVRELQRLMARDNPNANPAHAVNLVNGELVVTGAVSGTSARTPTANLQAIDDIRKAINADITSARTSSAPTRDITLANLGGLHRTIDETVAGSNLSDAAKTAYGDALRTYREQYIPRFKTGENARIFRSTSLNEPQLNPDNVIKTYFQPGGEREAQQFLGMFGGNENARQSARTGIMDLYREKVIDPQTGSIDSRSHNRFMESYARPLEILDNAGMGLRGALSRFGERASELAGRQVEVGRQAKTLGFETPEALVDAVIKSPRTMNTALARLGPQERQSLGKSVLDTGWRESGGNGVKLGEWLADNQRTVRMALSGASGKASGQHYSDLQDVAKALEIAQRSSPGHAGGSPSNDPLRNATGVSIPTVWAQSRSVAAGRQHYSTAIAMVAGPALTKLGQTQFDEIMFKALHDPKTASALKQFLQATPQTVNARATVLSRVLEGTKAVGSTALQYMGSGYLPESLARVAPRIISQEQELIDRQGTQ